MFRKPDLDRYFAMADCSLRRPACVKDYPGVRFIKHEAQKWYVVATKSCGFLPLIAIAEQTQCGNRVTKTALGPFPPHANHDQAATEFMNWSTHHHLAR